MSKGSADGMTGYAHSYLLALVYRHLLTGLVCLFVLSGYAARLASVATVEGFLPLPAWGGLFLVVAALGAAAEFTSSDRMVHVAVVTSVALSVAWALWFAIVWIHGQPSLAPLVVVSESTIIWKDLTFARTRLRDPLNSVADRLAPPDRGRREPERRR